MSATPKPVLPPLDIGTLIDSFEIALKSARRSPSTLTIYLSSIRLYLQWCADNGHPAQIDRGQVSAWIAAMLDGGAQPTTAAARLAGVRQFSKWLAAEGGRLTPTRCYGSMRRRVMCQSRQSSRMTNCAH